MSLLDTSSLAATLDALNESLLFSRRISAAERDRASRWIAQRQGQAGGYRGLFAPTQADFSSPVPAFTGEMVRSRAAKAHILGEEAARVLRLLNSPDRAVKDALACANEGMIACLNRSEARGYPVGTFCCSLCSCAYWRNLAAGNLDRAEERLHLGMKALKAKRLDSGRWHGFPFYYALHALIEIPLPAARAELAHAAKACETLLKRKPGRSAMDRRRREILVQAVARVS